MSTGTMTIGNSLSLEEALLADMPSARLVATGFSQIIGDWATAEMRRPNVDVGKVMAGLVDMQLQTTASIAAHILDPECLPRVLDQILEMYRLKFMEHVRLMQEARDQ